jgi:uncharacterized membrane protein
MAKVIVLGTAATLSLLIALGAPAEASWRICNKTADSMDVAIAYVNPSGGFISEGYWEVPACGGCKQVLSSDDTSDQNNVFVYAKTTDGTPFLEGGSEFCVGKSPFTRDGKGNCRNSKGFRHVVIDLAKGHTTNITGKAPSGRQCMD